MEVTQDQVANSAVNSPGIFSSIFSTLGSIALILMVIAIAVGATVFALYILLRFLSRMSFNEKVKKELRSSQNSILYLKISPFNENKEDAMEQFLKSLHRVLPNKAFVSLEMFSTNQFLHFFIVTPKEYKSLVESQLYAHYPDTEIQETTDFLPNLAGVAAMTEFRFKRNSIKPLKTFRNLEENLVQNLSAILSKSEPKDQVYIQLILKRVGGKIAERGFSAGYYKTFGAKVDSEGNPTPQHQKLSQDIYKGKLRVGYLSTDKATSAAKLHTLFGIFKLLKGTNEFKKPNITFSDTLAKAFKARVFEKGDYWTPTEAATVYHFPFKGSLFTNIVSSTSKRAPAPDTLPIEGTVDPKEVSFFGMTNYQNDRKIFGVKREDRRRHLYVIGKTGSGKSRLLELLLIADIQNGHGCCLLDPHGDLAQELLMFVPKERIKDVVYIDPTDRDFPIGFNPLEPVENYEMRQHLSTFFISIFKKLFAASWNPRMEHLLRYITLALLETPDSNVLGIPRILSDTTYRQRVIMQIQDPVVKAFWVNEFSTSSEQLSREAIVPIVNKVGQFVSNPTIRNMVGQKQNQLDFRKFMDEGKIVIINNSKGKLGDENAALLGSMLITKIQQAALSRANVGEEQRRDFYFYVDEFQNFATDAFASILSEARKYRLDLTIAHQYMAQLPDEVKATAFGNVGTIISFALGGDDASYLAKEFAPTFTAEDLIKLDLREMYIKMSIDGKLHPPFSAVTINVPKPPFDFSEEILNHSRTTYGKNKVEVENEIAQWSGSSGTQAESAIAEKKDEFPEPIL